MPWDIIYKVTLYGSIPLILRFFYESFLFLTILYVCLNRPVGRERRWDISYGLGYSECEKSQIFFRRWRRIYVLIICSLEFSSSLLLNFTAHTLQPASFTIWQLLFLLLKKGTHGLEAWNWETIVTHISEILICGNATPPLYILLLWPWPLLVSTFYTS